MSKIKVNELESKTENANVKLSPLGNGVVEVKGAGGNDGTLELKTLTGNNGVKLKSPPHSAGQSYTLTLPDNNVEADKFLRVKSIQLKIPMELVAPYPQPLQLICHVEKI